jgi:hypothetical protein
VNGLPVRDYDALEDTRVRKREEGDDAQRRLSEAVGARREVPLNEARPVQMRRLDPAARPPSYVAEPFFAGPVRAAERPWIQPLVAAGLALTLAASLVALPLVGGGPSPASEPGLVLPADVPGSTVEVALPPPPQPPGQGTVSEPPSQSPSPGGTATEEEPAAPPAVAPPDDTGGGAGDIVPPTVPPFPPIPPSGDRPPPPPPPQPQPPTGPPGPPIVGPIDDAPVDDRPDLDAPDDGDEGEDEGDEGEDKGDEGEDKGDEGEEDAYEDEDDGDQIEDDGDEGEDEGDEGEDDDGLPPGKGEDEEIDEPSEPEAG